MKNIKRGKKKNNNVPSTREESQGNHHFPPVDGHTAKPNTMQLTS